MSAGDQIKSEGGARGKQLTSVLFPDVPGRARFPFQIRLKWWEGLFPTLIEECDSKVSVSDMTTS